MGSFIPGLDDVELKSSRDGAQITDDRIMLSMEITNDPDEMLAMLTEMLESGGCRECDPDYQIVKTGRSMTIEVCHTADCSYALSQS